METATRALIMTISGLGIWQIPIHVLLARRVQGILHPSVAVRKRLVQKPVKLTGDPDPQIHEILLTHYLIALTLH